MSYVGRFAPSPTGPLHIGSLTTAVASYLDARQAGGKWLVRMDDIDPPREVPGAANEILRALEALALHWDGSVLYQSSRLEAYYAAARRLLAAKLAFRCSCSRKALRAKHATGCAHPNRYPGTCRKRRAHGSATAIRVRVDAPDGAFEDGLQQAPTKDVYDAVGDYVILRRDGLPAYHLACVLDDAWQGVTSVVRGSDLLESTAVHRHLQRVLELQAPRYFHLPVLVNEAGQKLSKQTGALAVDLSNPGKLADTVLRYLGLEPPMELRGASALDHWGWARNHWRIDALKGLRTIGA